MAEVAINVMRVAGQTPRRDGEFSDEFDGFNLQWKEPGMTYCFISTHPQLFGSRKRAGWKVCNLKDDFVAKGCPDDLLPASPSPDGTVRMGALILAKMPVARRAAMMESRRAKTMRKRKGQIDAARGAGEDVAAYLRRRGINVGRSLVYEVDRTEERADYDREYVMRTREGVVKSYDDPNLPSRA